MDMLISDMQIGQIGYIVSWAIVYYETDKEQLYINTHYHIEDRQGGTSKVKVRRTEHGYEVEKANLEPTIIYKVQKESTAVIAFYTQPHTESSHDSKYEAAKVVDHIPG